MKRSIQPRESILCTSPSDSDYSFESSWVRLYQLCTSGFGDFLPFFLEDLLKLGEVGWGVSANSNLQFFPPILNGIQVWALGLFWSNSQCCFGCMLGVIVLFEHKSSPPSQVFYTLKRVLLKDLPVFGSIHCSLYHYKPSSLCCRKASP